MLAVCCDAKVFGNEDLVSIEIKYGAVREICPHVEAETPEADITLRRDSLIGLWLGATAFVGVSSPVRHRVSVASHEQV